MTNEKQPTPEQLRAMLESDKQQRQEAFRQYIEEGAQRYNCTIRAMVSVSEDGRIVAAPTVVAL
jgi:hypothetical protein